MFFERQTSSKAVRELCYNHGVPRIFLSNFLALGSLVVLQSPLGAS